MVSPGMEESSTTSAFENGGASGSASNSADGQNSSKLPQNADKMPAKTQYSVPGVLHFIQHEWARFEMERATWDVERAELQARIAFLQGERKGQENLKNDLVRRIKMLEYALKQERVKFHKVKYGTDLEQEKLEDEFTDDQQVPMDIDAITQPNSNASWRQGRQLLRQYLQEIGYTDSILDVRSLRVRALLDMPNSDACNFFDKSNRRTSNSKLDSEAAEIDYRQQNADAGNFFDASDEEKESDNVHFSHSVNARHRFDGKPADGLFVASKNRAEMLEENVADATTIAEDEAAVDEAFDFLSPDSKSSDSRVACDSEWSIDPQTISRLKEQYRSEAKSKKGARINFKGTDIQLMLDNLDSEPNAAGQKRLGKEDVVKSVAYVTAGDIDMGDLAMIGNMNDLDPVTYDVNAGVLTNGQRKTWENRYNLRSHFDSVRAIGFHPVEAVLITASEDSTMKLWNLQRSSALNKKGTTNDLEPVYTFRGHTQPVLCLCMSPTGDACYSGSMDGTIKCWMIPSPNIDLYDSYDPRMLVETLPGHKDSVWSVAFHASDNRLVSAGADGMIKLWEPGTANPCLQNFHPDSVDTKPTSVDFVNTDPQQLLGAYTDASAFIFDLESGKSVLRFESKEEHPANSKGQINQIVSHPTLPITITAHEDRLIRFFDNNTGKLIDCIPAHLDAVTCLSVDPNGLYLLSGSHDCSIRLWSLEQGKQCIQEITAHRKKFDESVFAVAFHPSRPYLASGGADGIAKVFV